MIRVNYLHKTKGGHSVLIQRRDQHANDYFADIEYKGICLKLYYNDKGEVTHFIFLDITSAVYSLKYKIKNKANIREEFSIQHYSNNNYAKATKIMESLQ